MPDRLHAPLGEELVASRWLSGRTHVVGSCYIYKEGSAFWVEEFESLHGTFLDGRAIHDAAVGPNALLTLGTARDAPRLLCLTAEEAMATPLDDDPVARIQGQER